MTSNKRIPRTHHINKREGTKTPLLHKKVKDMTIEDIDREIERTKVQKAKIEKIMREKEG